MALLITTDLVSGRLDEDENVNGILRQIKPPSGESLCGAENAAR
jgi:hypothetical protein